MLNIAKDIEKPLLQSSIGLFNFQHNVTTILRSVSDKPKEAAKLSAERITYHKKAIEKCKSTKENLQLQEPNFVPLAIHKEALATSYADHADIQCKMQNYPDALHSNQCALDIRLELYGERHLTTAESYHSLGITQHEQGDFTSALQSQQRALNIRLELFTEQHLITNDGYHLLGVTQQEPADLTSTLQSEQCVPDIRPELCGGSYHSVGVTQFAQGDFSSALHS